MEKMVGAAGKVYSVNSQIKLSPFRAESTNEWAVQISGKMPIHSNDCGAVPETFQARDLQKTSTSCN